MRRREFLAASVTMAGALAARQLRAQPATSRAAVVIGVNRPGDLIPLRGAASGAREVSDWLTTEGFNVKLFVDDAGPVRMTDIKAAVKSFVDHDVEQLVVYFAGHGFISGSLSEFWMLSNAPDDLSEAISLTESQALALQLGIKNVVFISDACRSRSDDARIQRIRGDEIFPNPRGPSNVTPDVDVFLATRIGDAAWEMKIQDSVAVSKGIYTECFLQAFRSPYAEMVTSLNGRPIIPSRRLKVFLENEVPKRARALSITVTQQPAAQICSYEPTFIAHVSGSTRLSPNAPAPTLSDVANAAIGLNLGGAPAGPPAGVELLARSSGFLDAKRLVVEARGVPGGLGIRTGFAIYGQGVDSIATRQNVVAKIFTPNTESQPTMVAIELRDRPGASVGIRFRDGSGTVVAALHDYIGSILVDNGRVSNVSYFPAPGTPLAPYYDAEKTRLQALHAAIAASARFGVFRFEGSRDSRNRTAGQLAGRIRVLKSIDPTLGLYASYAYAEAGLPEQVRSVRSYMHFSLNLDLFDVAMLSSDPLRPWTPLDRTWPFCPMLAQGWALLRAQRVRLPESVDAARDHLRPSLWTCLDKDGMDIVEPPLRAGTVL